LKTSNLLAMNSRLLLATIAIAALASCSTAYKAQTPDDVYYSPAKSKEEYVRVETQKDRDAYTYEEDYADDRYLRWKVRNRSRWSAFDAYGYDYDWYDYRYSNLNYGWNRNLYWNSNSYWNNYWYWNNSYNPYVGKVIIVNPKSPVANNQVRNYKPGTYRGTYNTSNGVRNTSPGTYRPTGAYNNSNSNTQRNAGKFGTNSSNNNSSSERPNRTYTPSNNNNNNSSPTRSSSSGSSSGSGGGGGGVSRPSRGG
jgi:hypothetical protein